MTKKRAALKYVTLSLVSGGYAAAAWKAYASVDQPREPIGMADVKKIAGTAAVLTGLTWLVAQL